MGGARRCRQPTRRVGVVAPESQRREGQPMARGAEVAAMRQAIELARAHGPRTLPNPRVGCVLLDEDGATLATGVHRGAGTPHAEVDALTAAGAHARGATAVVT